MSFMQTQAQLRFAVRSLFVNLAVAHGPPVPLSTELLAVYTFGAIWTKWRLAMCAACCYGATRCGHPLRAGHYAEKTRTRCVHVQRPPSPLSLGLSRDYLRMLTLLLVYCQIGTSDISMPGLPRRQHNHRDGEYSERESKRRLVRLPLGNLKSIAPTEPTRDCSRLDGPARCVTE